MRLVTYFLHAPSMPGAVPAVVPISGDFERVSDAESAAIFSVTKNPRFKSWCVAFEIENEAGEIVAVWNVENASRS